jgi:hypothetical protein
VFAEDVPDWNTTIAHSRMSGVYSLCVADSGIYTYSGLERPLSGLRRAWRVRSLRGFEFKFLSGFWMLRLGNAVLLLYIRSWLPCLQLSVLPNETELDKLFIATLEAGKDKNKNLLKLCGPNTSITPVLKVTVHGTCIDAGKISASAAAATCWVPMHVLTRQVVHMDLGPALALN